MHKILLLFVALGSIVLVWAVIDYLFFGMPVKSFDILLFSSFALVSSHLIVYFDILKNQRKKS